jgi:hypothetical protein
MGTRTRNFANNILSGGTIDGTDFISGAVPAPNIANSSAVNVDSIPSISNVISPVAGDPPSPSLGDIWYNSVAKKLKYEGFGVASWASGGNYPTSVQGMGAAGTQTASVTAGGAGPTNLAAEYNGSSWTTITNYPISLRDVTGTGVQTAGLMISGYSTPGTPGNREKTNSWNGSAWSAEGDLNDATDRQLGGSAGILTAALFWGGDNTPTTAFEEYNGTAWTNLTATPFGSNSSGSGTSTSALATPGSPGSASYEYNGSSWTAGGTINTARQYHNLTGVQTSSLLYGGLTQPSPGSYTAVTESYDGSSWSNDTSMSNARGILGHGSAGTTTSALATAGYASPGALNATEEYSGAAPLTKDFSND